MNQLYIEIELSTLKDAETDVFTSVPSFLALYVYRFLNCPENIKLNFVNSTLPSGKGKIKFRSESLKHELTDDRILNKNSLKLRPIRDLRLPVFAKEEDIYIAGTCAVCRELIAQQPTKDTYKLLGFKQSCLLAPSESSIWTRFCEVDVVEALSRLLRLVDQDEVYNEIPVECSRFERHMNEPVRMHNIYKLAREKANQEVDPAVVAQAGKKRKNKITIECSIPKEKLAIEHTFAEGVELTIADLILYPCMRLIYNCYPNILEQFPLTNTWLNEIDNFESKCQQILWEICIYPCVKQLPDKKWYILDSDATSLYKSDPKRYKPHNRIFTEQAEVETALNKLKPLNINFNSDSTISFGESTINWQEIEPAHAENSALPKERLLRKRQQLENLANAVVSLANKNHRIIDFCSGTGHLGILLALKLPHCEIILMENKAISLQRAKKRAKDLNLSNIRFYQCNIDYFEGNFDVGTSLHACGTASDIVLQQCRKAKASFVCCPCCYGSLQPMPHISYPLSKKFREVLTQKDFMYIAHTADQAHALGTLNCKPEITRQGQLCMDIVDTDRKVQAEEAGYEVLLTRLKPENCTPKNRLLVGRLKKENTKVL